MMKKIVAFLLVVFMALGICSCSSQPDNSSSEDVEVQIQQIVVDQNGDVIESSDSTTTQEQDNSSTQVPTESENIMSNEDSSTDVGNTIDYDTVVEVDICDDIVRGYLNADDVFNQYFWLNEYSGGNYNFQKISLDWKLDGYTNYIVYISEKSDFSNALEFNASATKEIKNTILVPGKTYYWKVIGANSSGAIGGGKIKVKAAPVRWITIDGINNVRDMGGWTTESGKTVKYEMLYRGAQLNTTKDGKAVNIISESGLKTLKQLGIKTEFDLRTDTDVCKAPEGIDLNYVLVANHTSYQGIFTSSNKDTVVSNYKKIFETLSDKSNYPIYTHCQGGADRTGTYAFLLNGLLGVSYDDLIRDFELTSFSGIKRWRSAGNSSTFSDKEPLVDNGITINWSALYKGMMEYGSENGCTTLQQSIEHWFINYIGIPKSQIDSFKSIMLE